jgi:hypothetical protein
LGIFLLYENIANGKYVFERWNRPKKKVEGDVTILEAGTRSS